MTTKRIRCSCGRVYDPVKRPACPDCGAPHVVAEPAPEPSKEAPAVSKPPATERHVPAPSRTPVSINPRLLAIAAAVLCLLVIVFALKQCGGKNKTTGKESGPSKVQPSASPSASAPIAVTSPVPSAVVHRSSKLSEILPGPEEKSSPPPRTAAEESDLAAMIASAAPGATVKIPAGFYQAGLVVKKPIHIVGDSKMGGQVIIQSEGKSSLLVQAKDVTISNVQFICNGIGELPAVSVADGAGLEMEGCKVQSETAVGLAAAGKASVKTTGTSFTAANGVAVRLQQGAKGNFIQSSFSNSTVGLSLTSEGSAELHSCAFENDATGDSNGSIIAISGGKTQITADDCHFTNNEGGINVSDKAALTLTNSPFKDNGGARRVVALIAIHYSASATLTGDTFESNRSGILVSDGGKLEMDKCRFDKNGSSQGQQYPAGSLPISVVSEGSSAIVRHTVLTNSSPYAINVAAGAQLTFEDSEVSGSRGVGFVVGDRNAPAGHAEIKRSHFLGNVTGIGICAAGSANVEDSECRENGDGIIVIDANSQVQVSKTQLLANRDHGLHVYNKSQLTASDCDIKDNARGAQSGYRGRTSQGASVTLENCRFGGNRTFAAGACTQSELILNRCVFDGSDKTNIFKEHGANVKADSETSAAPESSPHPTDSPERHHRTPVRNRSEREEDISRMIQRFLPPNRP